MHWANNIDDRGDDVLIQGKKLILSSATSTYEEFAFNSPKKTSQSWNLLHVRKPFKLLKLSCFNRERIKET